MTSNGFHYPALFWIFAGLSLLTAAAAVLTRLPEDPIERGLEPGRVGELFTGNGTLVVVVVLMNALYTSSESIPNIWIPKYFTDTFAGYPEFRSRLILSLFWGAVTTGRQFCALAVRRGVEPGRLLLFLAAASAVTLFLAPRLGTRGSAEILFAGSGLFFSAMFPIIASYSERLPVRMRTSFFILIAIGGTAGISATSRIAGLVSNRFGYVGGMLLGPVLMLLLIGAGLAAGKPGSSPRSG
jgi:fucose permease